MRRPGWASWSLVCGEALEVLRTLDAGSCAALVTDPPYSSGGAFRGDRAADPSTKYSRASDETRPATFGGDTRDQRAYLVWSTMWFELALRALKPGAAVCVFTDWRQLPTTTDALQCAGASWRGIVVWDKGPNTRPQRGRFRAQAEFLVWGSKGPMAERDVYLPGVITCAPPRGGDRVHLTQKPVELMRQIVQITEPGGVVLDPFAGSGSTGVAALAEGRRFFGVEQDPGHAATARARLAAPK